MLLETYELRLDWRNDRLEFDIWNENDPLLKSAYDQDNFIIKEYDNDSPYMAVYFASNGLYYPDTESCFREVVINNNRFEWLNIHRQNVKKEIYVRDIFKAHYVRGINSRINSMNLLIDFIKKESEGYRLITVGNSAGGYAAAVVGTVLHADMVFDFSGQTDITSYTVNPAHPAAKLQSTSASKFFVLSELWKTYDIPQLFYFFSANNENDRSSWSEIEKFMACGNLYPFAFNTYTHEKTMYHFNLPTVLDMGEDELRALSGKYNGKKISRLMFSIDIMGVNKTIKSVSNKLVRKAQITEKIRRFMYKL